MIANWVQTQVLDSNEFANSTEEILKNKDVQEQLSIFAVDQLYANVDVQAQVEQRLPPPAQPLAAPVAAATRQLAVNVAKTALASPQVQNLVATSINGAQQRFVNLIEDKGQFVSSEGGVVTLEYGSFVAELATRLGVDPSTISEIQGFIQQYSTELKQRLTTMQSKIESTRATLSQAQAGTLSPGGATEPHDSRNGCRPASHDHREPRAEDHRNPAEGPRPAPEQVVRPPGPSGPARHAADRSAATGRRGAQGSEPGEHHQARPRARLPADASHRPAQPSGDSAPRRARRDEVQPTERSPGSREGAAQPGLRAAAAGPRCCIWPPSTWRRDGGGRR